MRTGSTTASEVDSLARGAGIVPATRDPDGRGASLVVGFVTARSAHFDGAAWWVDPGLGRLVEAIAGRVGRVEFAPSGLRARERSHTHRLDVQRVVCRPLPAMTGVVDGLRVVRASSIAVRVIECASDVLVAQLPFAALPALIRQRRPRVLHLCGDVRASVLSSPFYRGFGGLPARSAARWLSSLERWLTRRPKVRVVANGRELLEREPRALGRSVVSSTLFASEVGSIVRGRQGDGRPRVLFVGFPRFNKGGDLLASVLREVRRLMPEAELRLIGSLAATEAKEGGALAWAQGGQASGSLTMSGYIPFGPDLFQEYADGDVLICPSRSEGTPRALVEARAFGCPVVAMRVGGIPTSVRDGEDGILVEPGDVCGMASAVVRLLTDRELRSRIVSNGYEMAQRTTVEFLAQAIVEECVVVLGHD